MRNRLVRGIAPATRSGAPKVVADLRLHQRKAFELCAVVLGAFRKCGANPSEDALKDALERARKIAKDELRTQNNDVPLASFLANALTKVVGTAKESAETFPLSKAGQGALDLLTQLQTTLPNGTCQMAAVFAECHAAAQNFYLDHLTRAYQAPEISLCINYTDEANKAFPGRNIAFNGSVLYKDEADTNVKHSAVTLRVHPVLNSGCLPVLPYILMHEIFCHWPQMSRWEGVRPNPETIENPHDKDASEIEIDPFSEGWMDSLVAEVLSYHFRDADAARAEEAKTAEGMHLERVQFNRNPAFKDAGRIAPGSEAAREIRWFYVTDDDPEIDPSTADLDFLSLSCELNIAAWAYDERREGCNALLDAGRAYREKWEHGIEPSERHAAILDALRGFRKNHDPIHVLEALAQH
jgi:hypothetical protein